MFQSTPPHGGRRQPRPEGEGGKCFNPRPRMGGDALTLICVLCPDRVSIHAPAWGATTIVRLMRINIRFQSTPPHGGRPCGLSMMNDSRKFQSTPPHGGRRRWCLPRPTSMRFNPRPRMGGDDSLRQLQERIKVSIHAPAWGATTRSPARSGATISFNPRPRMGGDRTRWHTWRGRHVSIHAPAWGATSSCVSATFS